MAKQTVVAVVETPATRTPVVETEPDLTDMSDEALQSLSDQVTTKTTSTEEEQDRAFQARHVLHQRSFERAQQERAHAHHVGCEHTLAAFRKALAAIASIPADDLHRFGAPAGYTTERFGAVGIAVPASSMLPAILERAIMYAEKRLLI